jgi:flagellar basal-body rod protein FlgB
MNAFGDKSLETITGWIHGLSSRQQAISNNIANIDTPGYTRQEVNFETELQRQIGTGSEELLTDDPRQISGGAKLRNALGVDPTQLLTSSRLDSNNVSIDQEMVSLSDTQMRYQAASTALTTKFDILKKVIQG